MRQVCIRCYWRLAVNDIRLMRPTKQPAEILTIANHILGTGQLSLAKFLFITADETGKISIDNIPQFFQYMLERIDLTRDIHFYTNTTIDTLDYSGTGLNSGSKVVLAAYGDSKKKFMHRAVAPDSRSFPVLKMPKW